MFSHTSIQSHFNSVYLYELACTLALLLLTHSCLWWNAYFILDTHLYVTLLWIAIKPWQFLFIEVDNLYVATFLVILSKLVSELPTTQSPLSHTWMNMDRSLSWKHIPVWKARPGQVSRISKQAILETGTWQRILDEERLAHDRFLCCSSIIFFLASFSFHDVPVTSL